MIKTGTYTTKKNEVGIEVISITETNNNYDILHVYRGGYQDLLKDLSPGDVKKQVKGLLSKEDFTILVNEK